MSVRYGLLGLLAQKPRHGYELRTAFGILSGMYLGYVIVKAMAALFPMRYSFPLGGILASIAIGLLFGALAAVIPAWQAAKMQVVEALLNE